MSEATEDLRKMDPLALVNMADRTDPMIDALASHLTASMLKQVQHLREIESIKIQLAELGITLEIIEDS